MMRVPATLLAFIAASRPVGAQSIVWPADAPANVTLAISKEHLIDSPPNMKSICLRLVTAASLFLTAVVPVVSQGIASSAVPRDLPACNVVWDSPSKDATGSMPLCGGNLGLNVWVEGDDVLFYLGSPDSRTEDGKLVKLGRVRLSLPPGTLATNFRQELDLAESCIRISADGIRLMLWVDAFESVVHGGLEAAKPVDVRVTYESWRFNADFSRGGLEWHYRPDPAKDYRLEKIRQQKVDAIASFVPDPMKNLTFGGRIVADGLVPDGTGEGSYMNTRFKSWKLRTAMPVSKLDLRVLLRVAQDASVEAWRGQLDHLTESRSDRAKTLAFWNEFWGRSWVFINPGSESADEGWQVGRNYQLFRYLLAANRTGAMPTLFNGGLFTFDNPLPTANAFGANGPNPDERAWWGCCFMGQNQRLVYWPMLKAGDNDALKIGLDFYRDRAPLAEAKARQFLAAEGTLFTESLDPCGLIAACPSGNGLEAASHLAWHFSSALEFAFMMVEQCRFTGADITPSLPVVLGMLRFYDSHYQNECRNRTGNPLDANSKLVIFPGNSCEHGVGCKNHVDAVAGLHAIADGLLALPGISKADQVWLEAFRRRLPMLATTGEEGHRVIALAESWQSIANPNEFPQIYAMFPFHRYGVGLPDIETARNTWNAGTPLQKEAMCWKHGNVAVAMLGLADEAKDYALKKFLWPYRGTGVKTLKHGNCAQFIPRFPAFWNCYPFDHFPDMDHGGCAMVGLQEMLLQTPGDRLLVLPAWPREWDVRFKLRAPRNTTVEGELRGGKMIRLEVTPASRQKDVEVTNDNNQKP